jgi:hypothetical protein
MMLCSIYTLHDRSRQSTKTCAECHTFCLVGYGGGILDDIFQYLHLYEVLRGEISKVRAFFAGTSRARHPMRFVKCSVIYFSVMCIYVPFLNAYVYVIFHYFVFCLFVSFLNMYFFVIFHFFPPFSFFSYLKY